MGGLFSFLILPVLLYASEVWTLPTSNINSLESFHMNFLRHTFEIPWYDHIRNTKIAEPGCRHSLFGHTARLGKNTPAPLESLIYWRYIS